MADAGIRKGDPGVFHITNLVLHLLNTLLLFALLRWVTGYRWRSAAVAALFGETAQTEFPKAVASSSWKDGGYDAGQALDGNPATRWNAADGEKCPQWLEVDFGVPKIIVKTVVREAFDRARAYQIQAWDGEKWIDCATGERFGAEKTDTFAPVTTHKVRLCVNAIASDSISISEFEVYDAKGRNLAGREGLQNIREHANGGRTCFIPSPNAGALKKALELATKSSQKKSAPSAKPKS